MDLEENPHKEFPFPELSCPVPFPWLMAVSALCSGQWWHSCPGEPGWHPEATPAFPPWRALAAVPVLPGERPPAPWAAGSTPVVTEGKGGCLFLHGLSAWHEWLLPFK